MPEATHRTSDEGGDRDNQRAVPIIPLESTFPGQQVVLARLTAGRRLKHRLAEMGLICGTQFTILARGNPGPFVILIKDTRLVLGRGMIHRIFVHPA